MVQGRGDKNRFLLAIIKKQGYNYSNVSGYSMFTYSMQELIMKNLVMKMMAMVFFLGGCTLASNITNPVDDTNPFVIILSQPADHSTNSGRLVVKGSVYHQEGLSASDVHYTPAAGGQTNSLSLSRGGTTLYNLYGELDLANGTDYLVWISASDPQGRTVSSPASLVTITSGATNTNTIDTTPPVVVVTTPTNLQKVGAALTVSGTVTDDNSGVETVYISLNDGPYVSASVYGQNWSRGINLVQNGTNTLRIYARDLALNTSTIQTIKVILDNAVPSVNITSPVSGILTNQSAITVSGTASVSGSTISQVYVKLNSGSWNPATDTTSWTRSATLTEGWNNIQALAIAGNGYSNLSSTIQVRLDSQRPTVSVTSPASGATLSSNISLSGTATDTGSGVLSVYYKVDSASWAQATGTNSWSAQTTLSSGAHTLLVFARDVALNTSLTSSVSFSVSNATVPAPVVSASPAGGNFYSASVSVTLSLSGSGITVARYTTNGSDPSVSGITFTQGTVISLGSGLAADQSQTLRLYAQNGGGSDSKTYTFTKRAGEIKPYITNPTLGKSVPNGTVVINGQKGANEWTDDMIIALDMANDDPRSLGDNWTMHETPWDLTHLYACWDDNNLYIAWQYVDCTDIFDPSNAGSSAGTKPFQMNLLQLLIIDTIPNQGATKDMWGKNGGTQYFGGADLPDFQIYVAGNLWQGYISEATNNVFVVNNADPTYYQKFMQNPSQGSTVGTPVGNRGIEMAWINTCVPAKLWGVMDCDDALADPIDPAKVKDFKTMGHDGSRDTFYEMKIPLASLKITRAYLEANGIGIKLGQGEYSCMDTIPNDPATSDTPGVTASNSPKEWEDEDLLTTPFARIGHAK